MAVGNVTLAPEVGQAFIDSGTTFSYFPTKIFDAIFYEIKAYCDKTSSDSKYCPGGIFKDNYDGSETFCANFD